MLTYRSFPEDLFIASEDQTEAIIRAMESNKQEN
jgi:hypothetical protein